MSQYPRDLICTFNNNMTEIISTNRLIAETNAAIARYTQTLLRQILLNSNDNVLFASRPPTPFRYPTSPNFRPSSLRRPQPPPPPTNERTNERNQSLTPKILSWGDSRTTRPQIWVGSPPNGRIFRCIDLQKNFGRTNERMNERTNGRLGGTSS